MSRNKRKFMNEKWFPCLGTGWITGADLDSFLFLLVYFLIQLAGKLLFGLGQQCKKAKACCVASHVFQIPKCIKKRIIKYTNLQNTFWILISQQIWSTLEMKSGVSIHCFAHTESIHFSICRKKTHWDVELQLLSLSAKAGSQNYFKKQICRLLVWLL